MVKVLREKACRVLRSPHPFYVLVPLFGVDWGLPQRNLNIPTTRKGINIAN